MITKEIKRFLITICKSRDIDRFYVFLVLDAWILG